MTSQTKYRTPEGFEELIRGLFEVALQTGASLKVRISPILSLNEWSIGGELFYDNDTEPIKPSFTFASKSDGTVLGTETWYQRDGWDVESEEVFGGVDIENLKDSPEWKQFLDKVRSAKP